MKSLYCLIIVIFLGNCANAQWIKLNSGTANDLNDTYFLNSNVGYAVGDSGVIIKTIDGGISWKAQNSDVSVKLASVFFTDTLNGYVVGDSATLLKTANGGLKWVKHSLGLSTNIALTAIYFTNDSSGYITSNNFEYISNSSIILKTNDKWLSWLIDTLGVGVASSICFPAKDTAYLVGNCIRKTTNAGNDWQSASFNNVNLNSVAQNGYNQNIVAVGDNGRIVYGEPNTEIYNVLNPGTNENLRYINFDSFYHKYFVVGDKGSIFINNESDPITNWTSVKSGVTCNLNGISTIAQENHSIIIVGDSGTVLKSTNYGNLWFKVSSGIASNLYSLAGKHGPNERSYIVGDSGVILQLYNNTINRISAGLTNKRLNYICYNGTYSIELAYYIVGEKGTIIKTRDFLDYEIQNVDSTIDLTYVHFYNTNTEPTTSGFACGFDNNRKESVILYTADGGTHWHKLYTRLTTKLKGGSDQHECIAGEGGTILQATQAHSTALTFRYWKHYNSFPVEQLLGSVFFINTKTGFAANRYSKLFKTVDGGNNWNLIPVNNVRSISFTDSLTGYVVGSGGMIMKTDNAGEYWTPEISNTTKDLNKIYSPNQNVSYAVGRNGTILKIWVVTVNNPVICLGDTAIITAKGNAIKYVWSTGDTASSIKVNPTASTTYTVTGYSAEGVTYTAIAVVTVTQRPNINVTVDHPVIQAGQSALLCANGADTYVWNTGKFSSCITVSPIETTIYTVIGQNSCGFTDTAKAVVTVDNGASAKNLDKGNPQVLLYPLPAGNSVIFELSETLKGDLYVYNGSGVELIKQSINGPKIEIDINNLVSGIYFVKFIHAKGIEVRKMIKQ